MGLEVIPNDGWTVDCGMDGWMDGWVAGLFMGYAQDVYLA